MDNTILCEAININLLVRRIIYVYFYNFSLYCIQSIRNKYPMIELSKKNHNYNENTLFIRFTHILLF
jgi:hypothetical protein